MSCEEKSCVYMKQIPHFQDILTLKPFRTVLACKQCLSCAYVSLNSDETTFSLENAILWIDLYFIRDQRFKVQNALCMMYLFIANMQLVDYCDVFISCLDSHSDGTHSLQSIHCWDSDETTYLFWPVLIKMYKRVLIFFSLKKKKKLNRTHSNARK